MTPGGLELFFVLSFSWSTIGKVEVILNAPTLWAPQILLVCPRTLPFTSFYLMVGGCSSCPSPARAFSNP